MKMKEKLKRLHDICDSNNCFDDKCPLMVDKGCLIEFPPSM